ncbi:uncharacterized protein LOC127003425 [Eriocheir sinensis]|uniref:uncharacterized protein LOC127003425 n=1 Tax=Eriocheir sinensis TaxID=95602 RepID=UPI0021C8E79E|nr:uncharacterized protein LOC127003425 [Eriocheir sinensis]
MGSVGVRLRDHHHLKYTVSLTRVGQQVYSSVFSWGYTGSYASIRDALFSLPNYNATKFRKDFNGSQRERINQGDPVATYDITLMYKLLQLLCGLKDASDSAWVTEADTLEYLLYTIKALRNEVAHETLHLTSEEMYKKLGTLKELFIKTIKKAGEVFSVGPAKVETLERSITTQLDAIKESPVPLSTVDEYNKEVLATRKLRLVEEGGYELTQTYDNLCEVSVAPWLVSGQRVVVESLFTTPTLRREQTHIRQRQLSSEESLVACSDILQATECDGSEPHMTLVSAISGMGKSTLLRYLLYDVKTNGNVIVKMDSFDLVLFLECRHSTFASVEDLAALLLPRTAASFQSAEFQRTLFALDFLLVLDDMDELDQTSFSVFLDFMRKVSPASRFLATVTRDKADSIKRKILNIHKNVLLLEIEGIPEDKVPAMLQRTLSCGSPSAQPVESDIKQLQELIRSKRPFLQEHLKSPEILSLIALCWTLSPERINASITVTEVVMLVEDLLIHKVVHKLMGSSPATPCAQHGVTSKLQTYLLTLSGMALQCLVKGKYVLDGEDIQKLMEKCRAVELPENYMMSAFLNYSTDPDNGLCSMPRVVPFPRTLTLLYYAAWYAVQRLRVAPPSTRIRQFLKLQPPLPDESQTNNLLVMMKYLVGMLDVLAPGELRSRAREIADLLKELGAKTTSQWLQYVEEAKEEPKLTQEIMKEVGDEWEVEDFAISLTLANLIKQQKPKRLVLTTLHRPDDYPHLQEVLGACACTDTTLSLHLYQHFWSEKNDVSDRFLETLTNAKNQCKMEHFAGRLTGPAIQTLPSSLLRLALHITPSDLGALNAVLPSLTALQMLYLNLDLPPDTQPNTLPTLTLQGRPVILSVDLWRITLELVQWSCDVVRALSKHYTRLVLRRSELDRHGCSEWVAGLREGGVTVDALVVGSTRVLTPQDREHIQTLAAEIGCKDLKVIKV